MKVKFTDSSNHITEDLSIEYSLYAADQNKFNFPFIRFTQARYSTHIFKYCFQVMEQNMIVHKFFYIFNSISSISFSWQKQNHFGFSLIINSRKPKKIYPLTPSHYGIFTVIGAVIFKM